MEVFPMNNYTMNSYEVKRDLINFSKKISVGVNSPTSKFVMDMQFGLAKSGSCLISEIARSLNEDIKLSYTIERLCDNLTNLYNDEVIIILNNYLNGFLTLTNKKDLHLKYLELYIYGF